MYRINLLEFLCRKRVVDTMCADMRDNCVWTYSQISQTDQHLDIRCFAFEVIFIEIIHTSQLFDLTNHH